MLFAALLCFGWHVSASRGELTAGEALYQRLLADRSAACPLLSTAPEETALCNATKTCLDHLSKEVDYATFRSLCAVLQTSAGENSEKRSGDEKKPGTPEVSYRWLPKAVEERLSGSG
jgi:hypothetical protein